MFKKSESIKKASLFSTSILIINDISRFWERRNQHFSKGGESMKPNNYRKYTLYEQGNYIAEDYAPIIAKKAGVSVKTVYNVSSKQCKQGKREIYPVK